MAYGFSQLIRPFTNPSRDPFFKKPASPFARKPVIPAPASGDQLMTPVPPDMLMSRAPATPRPATPNSAASSLPVTPASAPTAPARPPVAPTSPIYPTAAAIQPPATAQAQIGASPQATPPQKPAIPALPPETQTAVTKAEEAVKQSTKISPEEMSTQEDVDKLIDSTRRAYTDVSGQPIPMEFITGQLAAIEKRALNLAEPLERKLARMQAQRLSSLEASKHALTRADKAAENIRTQEKDIRTEEESARRFGVEQTGAEAGRQIQRDQLGQQAAQQERAHALSLQKFEEDKRQFGMQYALDQRKVAVDEKKAAAETAGATNISNSLNSYQLVSDLLRSDTGKITGAGQFVPKYLGYGEEINKYNQLKGVLALDNRKALKGSGAISDFEAKVLDQAASALGRNLNNDAFRRELARIQGVFAHAAGLTTAVRITDPNTGESGIVETGRAGVEKALRDKKVIEYVEA